jgi:glycyl-tRNA synthetase beta chain
MAAHNLGFSLQDAIAEALKPFQQTDRSEIQTAVYAFIQRRIAHLLAEEGFAKDIVAAVISVSIDHIPNVWQRVAALQHLKGAPGFEPLAVAFKRAVNILRKTEEIFPDAPDAALFKEASEDALYDAYLNVKEAVERSLAVGDIHSVLQRIATLRVPVDQFFDDVMVMAEEKEVRHNRLALLKAIASLFNRIADFSKIAT